MLAEGWTQRRLGDLGKIITGATPPTENASSFGDDYPFVTPVDLGDKKYIFSAERGLSASGLRSVRAVPAGSVLFTSIGIIGKIGIAGTRLATNQQINSIVPEAVDGEYLFYALTHRAEHIRRLAGVHVVPIVNKSSLAQEVISIPEDRREQRAIAQMLSTWDAAIEKLNDLIAARRQRKRGLMQVLLTGKKRFKEFHSARPFERLSIKDIAEVDSRQLSSNTAPDFAFDYVSLSDVSQGRIIGALPHMRFTEAPSRARKLVQKRDVLLSTVRPNLQGFAMIGDDAHSLVVSTGFAVLSARSGLDPRYLYHYLFSDDMTKQIESLVTGSNYPAISTRDVKRLQVNVPTLSEQRIISSVLTTADVEIETLEKQRVAYKLQKRGLMQQLLTGKKRLKVEELGAVSA